MKKTTSLVLTAALLFVSVAFGKDEPKVNPFKQVLSSVPAAELPAQAADLVLKGKSQEQATITADVVKAAVGLKPAAAPAIVAAIAKKVPDMAPVAAGVAATEQPKQAAAIAKAAAAAAPEQVRGIVLAVCRAVPNQYRSVAAAVSKALPNASEKILDAVASAFPELRPYIQQTLVAYGGNVSSVPTVLDQAARLTQATTTPSPNLTMSPRATANTTVPAGPSATMPAPLARGPSVGPPYLPLTTTPTNVTPGTSGPVPEGGRNYAAP